MSLDKNVIDRLLASKNIFELFKFISLRFITKEAIKYAPEGDEGLKIISYGSLLSNVERRAKLLIEEGVKPGDRVVITGKSSVDWVISYFAVLACDATVVAIDPALGEHHIKELIEFSEPSIVLSSRDVIERVSVDAFCTRKTFILDEDCTSYSRDELSVLYNCTDRDPTIATILYTSGTTGKFKGVILEHKALLASVYSSYKCAGFCPDDNFLFILPAHHVFGLVADILAPFLSGLCVTIMAKTDAEHLSKTMKIGKPSFIVAVPRVYEFLVKKIVSLVNQKPKPLRYAFWAMIFVCKWVKKLTSINLGKKLFGQVHEAFGGNLRVFISGSAPISKDIFEFFEALGFLFVEGYGLTETSALVAANTVYSRLPNSVGKPVFGVEIKLINQNIKGEGEICVKGPTILRGYFRNAEADKASFIDGWFRTGDIGVISPAGNLSIIGRSKEIIILSNGEKVMPSLLETYLSNIPHVKDVAIVGLPNRFGTGEMLHLSVILDDDVLDNQKQLAVIKDSLRNDCIDRLKQFAHWCTISQIHYVDSIPKTTTLKVKREELKKQLLELEKSRIDSFNVVK